MQKDSGSFLVNKSLFYFSCDKQLYNRLCLSVCLSVCHSLVNHVLIIGSSWNLHQKFILRFHVKGQCHTDRPFVCCVCSMAPYLFPRFTFYVAQIQRQGHTGCSPFFAVSTPSIRFICGTNTTTALYKLPEPATSIFQKRFFRNEC